MKYTPEKQYPIALACIEKISAKGRGVGYIRKAESPVSAKVRVPLALPEEEVLVEIVGKRQGGYIGKIQEIQKASPDRVALRCPHALVCGGCTLQQLAYEKQLEHKEREVRKLFPQVESIFPIVPAPSIWQYRNKMEYTFSQDKEGRYYLGLTQAESKGRVGTITDCQIAPSWYNDILTSVLAWWQTTKLCAYNGYRDSGTLRTCTVREGRNTQDKMVILTVSGRPEFAICQTDLQTFVTSIKNVVGSDKLSIFLRIHQAIVGQPTQFYEMLLFGKDHLEEKLTIATEGYQKAYRFTISPTAFFQPNTEQAARIYSKALQMAGTLRRKRVLDLYAGTATLGMIFAPFSEKVLSIEINPYAVFDAQSNKEKNGVDNLEILQGDVAEVLQEQRKKDGTLFHPDLVLVDPPRMGLGAKALAQIIQIEPKEILYISCAPTTQAEDCNKLQEAGYEIVSIQPIDQFPHTVHVENLMLLRKRQ